jgi:hypothetical protein
MRIATSSSPPARESLARVYVIQAEGPEPKRAGNCEISAGLLCFGCFIWKDIKQDRYGAVAAWHDNEDRGDGERIVRPRTACGRI